MGLIKFIFFAALAVIFLYLTITSIQRLIQSGEEVEQANKELENLRKYGCTHPTVMEGLVMCP